MRRYSRKKNSTRIFVAATLVAAAVFGASHYIFNKRESGEVIAKVNDEKIYQSEIERKLRSIFDSQNQEAQLPEISSLPPEVIEILAKEIYLDRKLTEEAKKSSVGNDKKLQERITDLQDKILRQAYVDSLIKNEITDQKVNDKYAELSNDLTGKKEYLVSHIVVKTKEEADKVAKDLKAKKAVRFSDEAKKYSLDQESAAKGGELGYILEDNMIKEIATVITSLKKDEISDPIETKFGWHVVKYSDVRDAKALPFEAVRDNIREQLTQDKLNEINSKITKDAQVQILVELKAAEPKSEEKASPTDANAAPAPEASATAPAAESDVAPLENSENTPATTTEENKSEVVSEEKVEEKPAAKSQEKSNAKAKHKKAKHKKHNKN